MAHPRRDWVTQSCFIPYQNLVWAILGLASEAEPTKFSNYHSISRELDRVRESLRQTASAVGRDRSHLSPAFATLADDLNVVRWDTIFSRGIPKISARVVRWSRIWSKFSLRWIAHCLVLVITSTTHQHLRCIRMTRRCYTR